MLTSVKQPLQSGKSGFDHIAVVLQGEKELTDFLEEHIKNRPQRLCKMCGKCCKLATASKSYEELLSLSKEGDIQAQDFLKIFEPYPSRQAAIDAFPDVVENIIKYLDDPEKSENLTFYKCRHILDGNLCSIYNERPDVCKYFPLSPWAVVPPGCGYEGWLFQKREEKKQKIRKMKEQKIDFETMLPETTPEQAEKIKGGIETIDKIIEMFSEYGSADW